MCFECQYGRSVWILKKKVMYLFDSVFVFFDFFVCVFMGMGFVGFGVVFLFGLVVLVVCVFGIYQVLGYVGLMLVILFFGVFNMFGIGIVGNYVWCVYENIK